MKIDVTEVGGADVMGRMVNGGEAVTANYWAFGRVGADMSENGRPSLTVYLEVE